MNPWVICWDNEMKREEKNKPFTILAKIAKTNPIKYIFEKPALARRIARWQMALSEYDITYVSQSAIKGRVLAEHLTYHPLTDPQPLYHEFPDEHIMTTTEIELLREEE
ncbi:hypothetical protein CR513_06646, partial [Mucuna pruriens]